MKTGAFPDPVSTCGTPHGFPRIMNVPDVYEFAVTPQATWILAENGPGILRVYTDGASLSGEGRSRGPPTPARRSAAGRATRSCSPRPASKASKDNDVIVDRTGIVLSDASHATTRMRKVDAETIEAQMVIEDPKAFKAPWTVTKRYKKQPAGTWAWDYACAENNRNPITDSGKTLTLGPDGKPLDKKVD